MSDHVWSSDEEEINDLVDDFIESEMIPERVTNEVKTLQDWNESQKALELIIAEFDSLSS